MENNVNRIINVRKNTRIDSLSKALNIATEGSVIILNEGIYQEKVKITTPNIIIKGVNKNNVIITNSDYALKIHQDGKEYNTFRTYTVLINADNVTIENITIENPSGDGRLVGQAVALATLGHNIHINNCLLKAHQDTLFIGPLPKDLIIRYQNFLPIDELIYKTPHQVFIFNTTIIGDVDFIFGAGTGIFNNCEIISLTRDGFICAPATEIDDDEGFIFFNSIFKNKSFATKVFLARPWRDYGKATFINCLYNNHIIDLGFDKWNDTSRDKTARFFEDNCKYVDNHSFTRCSFCKSLSIIDKNTLLDLLKCF